jgi:hypothetical protein
LPVKKHTEEIELKTALGKETEVKLCGIFLFLSIFLLDIVLTSLVTGSHP